MQIRVNPLRHILRPHAAKTAAQTQLHGEGVSYSIAARHVPLTTLRTEPSTKPERAFIRQSLYSSIFVLGVMDM